MIEKVVIGFVGAALALIIREGVELYKRRIRRNQISAMCVEHLKMIRADLTGHVRVTNGHAHFEETQYCEVSVGDFLYQLITSNIECFGSIKSVAATVTFFHHYMVNMATVKACLGRGNVGRAELTEGTYNNLLQRLNGAIDELEAIASS